MVKKVSQPKNGINISVDMNANKKKKKMKHVNKFLYRILAYVLVDGINI